MTSRILTSLPLHGELLDTPVLGVELVTRADGDRYLRQVKLGKPGRCGAVPELMIILVDDSASMLATGADPVGKRYEEARLAIQTVGARCKCGRDHLGDAVAVYHFDTPVSNDLEPVSISKKSSEQIEHALTVPDDLRGRSLLAASLTRAYSVARKYEKTHSVVCVVLSDFELFDDVIGRFVDFPGERHAVIFNARIPPILLAAEDVTVTPVTHSSEPGIVARAIFRSLIRPREGAHPVDLGEALVRTEDHKGGAA